MARDLFLNICIYVTIIFIASQIFKNTGLGKKASFKVQAAVGIINGIFGIILMLFSVHITPKVILDFRELAIVAGSIYSGWKSVLVTGIIMAVFRLLYMGLSSYSITKAISIIIMVLCCIIIGKLKLSKKNKWIYMTLATGGVYSTSVALLVNDLKLLESSLIYFWTGLTISSLIVYCLIEYLMEINYTITRLKEEATKDFLTGLNNVRCFDKSFNELLGKAKDNDERVSLLIVDVDFFKKINDTYGHASGDAVLKQLSSILSTSVRDFDVVARIGGEEFGVILRDCSEARSFEIGERIRKNVEEHKFIIPNGSLISITLSIGVAVYPATIADINLLKEKADEKLYEAKHTGRNRVCI